MAEALVEASNLTSSARVVEVGAGTGPLTEVLLQHVEQSNFFVLEPNDVLAEQLRQRFSGLKVVQRPASELPQVLNEGDTVDRVLCSLPWSIFSEAAIEENIRGITSVLAKDGIFVTLVYTHAKYFSSSRRLRGYLERHFHTVELSHTTWRNLPPGQWLVCSEPKSNSTIS